MRVWRTRYSRLGNYSGRLTPNPVSMTPPTPAAVHHHPLLAGVAPAAQHQPSFFRIRNVSATDIRTMVCTDATGAVRCVYYSTWYQGQLDTYLLIQLSLSQQHHLFQALREGGRAQTIHNNIVFILVRIKDTVTRKNPILRLDKRKKSEMISNFLLRFEIFQMEVVV